MKSYPYFLSLLFIVFAFSCQSPTKEKNTAIGKATINVPKLLDRPEPLWQGEEWQNIQNTYGSARKALQDHPKDLAPALALVEVFIHEARVTGEHGHYYPAALAVLETVLQKETQASDLRFRSLSLKASVLMSQHEFKAALAVAQEAIVINRYNAQIHGILVDANVELGRYEKAVQMADKMISIRPDLRSYSRVSYLREIHGDTDGAIAAMQLALSAAYPGHEQSAWIRLQLGNLYASVGQLDAAEAQYDQILLERENYPFAIAAKAEIAIKKEDYPSAEKLLHQACAIIPEVGFYEQLAGVYQSLGQQEKLNEILPEIFTMLEDDIKSGHNMNLEYAHLHLNLTKDYDEALGYALSEYNKRPDNIDVNKTLSFIYFAKDDFAKAKAHLDKASSTQSNKSDLLCLQALLAIEEGNKDWGMKQLKTAFKNNPYQSHALAQKGKQKIS